MTVVQGQFELRSYTVTYDEFTAAGPMQKTVTVQAHYVEMDSEYVRLLRAREGVVFAVHRDRFATLTLDADQPVAPTA